MGGKQGNASMTCPAKRPEHVICAVNGNLVAIIEMLHGSGDDLLPREVRSYPFSALEAARYSHSSD